jgi:signal transduction histidine kinase
MLFSLDVLRTKMDDDDSRTVLLDNVRREAERMEKIVQNLLHFARNYKPRLAPCEIEQIVRASIEAVESILKKRNVTVELRNCARDGRAAVDRELMSQVFKNLLTNSVEASPAGRALVAEVLDVGEGRIGIAFTDKGEGVNEEDIARIFEPFHSSKEKGVGLGLAVSKKIVEAHSGWIEVRSERGKGTTFTVVLPRNL